MNVRTWFTTETSLHLRSEPVSSRGDGYAFQNVLNGCGEGDNAWNGDGGDGFGDGYGDGDGGGGYGVGDGDGVTRPSVWFQLRQQRGRS